MNNGLFDRYSWNLFYLFRAKIFISFQFLRIMKTSSLTIFIKQLPFLQRLSDRARDGYFYYLCGTCSPARYPTLAQKFRRLYETDMSKDSRYRRRKKGEAVYAILAYQLRSDPSAPVLWVLLRTDGNESIAADKTEKWRDVRTDRLAILDRYELHRHTRKDMSKPSWSWRFPKALHQELRDLVITLVRSKSDKRLQELIDSVNTAPKFAPIRAQIKGLHDLIRTEFKRSRSSQEKLPSLPRIGFTRRTRDQTRVIKLSPT